MSVSVSTLAERSLRRLNVTVVPLDDSPTLTEMIPIATIATMALTELGVIASDETPSATDQALALDKVASVHAALDAQSLVWWDGTAVPRAFTEEYTKLTAAQASSSFGKTADAANVAMLEARIRKGVMAISGHSIAQEAVMAVHNDLVARGMARWTSLDISEAAAISYEVLSANLMAPKFGDKADSVAGEQAMRSLARLVSLPSSGERARAEYF
jgi:sulfur transfer complex TusBCD TusB component (DsrH family)